MATLTSAALAGCLPTSQASPASTCGGPTLTAVAGDAEGPVYLLTGTAVVRAADSKQLATLVNDETTPTLLAPQAGGFILLNGGAAARRFDATGALLWTIGYGVTPGSVGALLDGDRLVLADAHAVRLYGTDGAPVWEQGIAHGVFPDSDQTSVTAASADQAGGAWVVGTTGGMELVLHLDENGNELAGSALNAQAIFDEAIGTTDSTGQPFLIVRTRDPNGVRGATGIDGTGQVRWTELVDQSATLVGDSAGNAFMLAYLDGSMQIDRWDATGQPTARTLSKLGISVEDHATWTAGADAGGILVASHVTPSPIDDEAACTFNDYLWQVDSADLGVNLLPLFPMPSKGRSR